MRIINFFDHHAQAMIIIHESVPNQAKERRIIQQKYIETDQKREDKKRIAPIFFPVGVTGRRKNFATGSTTLESRNLSEIFCYFNLLTGGGDVGDLPLATAAMDDLDFSGLRKLSNNFDLLFGDAAAPTAFICEDVKATAAADGGAGSTSAFVVDEDESAFGFL